MNPKQSLEEARLLKEARIQVLLSYGQKLLLVMIACGGFAALQWLGGQKDAAEDFRKTRWKWQPEIVKRVVFEDTKPSTSGTISTGGATAASPAIKQSSSGPSPQSPCPSVVDSTQSYSYSSRERMIEAMQELAEACVWANFRRTIKNATQQLEAAGDNPEKKQFAHFADYIAKEEALASVNAKVARQHVAAQLAGMHLRAEKPKPSEGRTAWEKGTARLGDGIREAAGDDSTLHIFYEMLWYAFLLTGVIASSILFLVLLNALPLTSAEGYWTARISEILKSIPTRSALAVPLLAAAIGGGTLAGSVAATEAGGQGRRPAKPPETSEPATLGGPGMPHGPNPPGQPNTNTPGGPWIYRQGDSKTDFFFPRGDLAFLPPLMDLREIESSLRTIDNTSRQFVEETRNARQGAALSFALGFLTMPSMRDNAEPLAVEALRQRVDALAKTQEDLGKRMDMVGDLKPLIQEVHVLAAALNARDDKIHDALQSVEKQGERQEKVAAQSLGQTAEIDQRGFLARAFGKTYYAVGPLVPSIMEVRLEDVMTSKADRKTVIDLLKTMRQMPPCPKTDFQENIRKGLEGKLQEETVESFMRDHFPALLKICALPRY